MSLFQPGLPLAKVWVLVEDPLTRELLQGAWSYDVDLRVEPVGGHNVVAGLADNARQARARNVFAVVDKDMGVLDGWQANEVTYRLKQHEAENYLLDFPVLGLLAREPPAKLAAEARAFAGRLAAWMAARRTLAEIDGDLKAGFPSAPPLPAAGQTYTIQEAIAHVSTSAYWSALKTAVSLTWNPAGIATKIQAHEQTCQGDLQAVDKWRETFSGKELLRHLREKFPGLNGQSTGSPARNDEDLAKRVTHRWSNPMTPPPQELVDLRREIRRRARLAP